MWAYKEKQFISYYFAVGSFTCTGISLFHF